MSSELSERFLNAFCRLEDELRRVTGFGSHESFIFMLDHAARSNAAFAHYRDDLREYAELRNAIVHKRIGDAPIAEPHPDIVARIESIAELVTQAPPLSSFFRKHVEICSPRDSLKKVLDLMQQGHFNQVPVYSGKKLLGLLTSDSIVFWLASSFKNSDFIDPNTRVSDLLAFAASSEDYALLPGSASIFDALEAFEKAYKRGRRLIAVIITENGNNDQHPIGIVTTLEVPRIVTLLNPENSPPSRFRH